MGSITPRVLGRMRLAEAVMQLATLDLTVTLYVQQPWSPASPCALVADEEGVRARDVAAAIGLDYFLEVDVMREALGVFGDRPTTIADKIRLLIHYAEFDAFPAWAQAPT